MLDRDPDAPSPLGGCCGGGVVSGVVSSSSSISLPARVCGGEGKDRRQIRNFDKVVGLFAHTCICTCMYVSKPLRLRVYFSKPLRLKKCVYIFLGC